MSNIETVTVRPGFSLPRIIKGGWQLAEDHSDIHVSADAAAKDMQQFVDAGITAFDCGDIYLGVEEKIGHFLRTYRQQFGHEAASRIKVATKFVPAFLDVDALRAVDRKHVEEIVARSLSRLGQERLDLMQLHWWDYATPGNVETALILRDLQAAGKIHMLGATNYDVPHLDEMVSAGVDLATHQVQYSLLDRRPENGMVDYCIGKRISLLCYGAVAGGLLSAKWLRVDDPGRPALQNVSLDKYYRIIRDFGGWDLFQDLLHVCEHIAAKHGVTIANVATRWVLERPGVGAVIVGARDASRLAENCRAFSFSLDEQDHGDLARILAKSSGPAGDCYGIDREENRDALEEAKTTYMDVVDGRLVTRTRDALMVSEHYGHHLHK